jgi:CheY-like chemotaxis protein/two-component sensor histidine kinase
MLALGTLAAAVAHEINNPLTYVMMNLETLRDRLAPRAGSDPASWEEKTILEEIRSGVERVRGAVDDLRRVARPEEKPGGDVDVRRVLELSIKLADHEIKHRARLVRDFGEIPSVTATEAALGQVFLDILINAAHAIADGAAAENEIRVVTRTDVAGRAVVEIRDTGAGMAQGIRARIFEPFFTTKAQGIGTGLGLSISYATVTSLGGFIEVESAEGRGSTFRVVLPPADASPVAAPDPPAPKVGAPSGKVLIVDDEPAIGRALARVIGRDRTVVVTSGREALALILEGKGFDAVLCDLMMPEMSGVDLYEELMRVAPEQAKKIVFMSGGAFTERARSFLARVGNAFLQKPIDTAKLLALVQQVMSG